MKVKESGKGSIYLFLAAFIWGMAFISQSKGMDYMHPLTFNGIRSLFGAIALLVYIILTSRQKEENFKRSLIAGIYCGIPLTIASTLQQFGIKYTTVGKAGFITALYIIIIPIGGLFFKKKVRGKVWIAAVLALLGLYLLCMTDSGTGFNRGDMLILLCAFVFAVQISIIDIYSPTTDAAVVCFVEMLMCGVFCTVGAFIWGRPELSQISDGLIMLLYAGVFSSGIAYTLQIAGQKYVQPTIAAVIMSMESVVAAIAGVIAYKLGFLKTDQTMNVRQVIGCIVVFAAVILAQIELPEKKRLSRVLSGIIPFIIIAFALSSCGAAKEAKEETLKITALNVGKADAFIIEKDRYITVIDAGTEESAPYIMEFLASENIDAIDMLIISHFDKDHVGGADKLIDAYAVKEIYAGIPYKESDDVEEFFSSMEKKGLSNINPDDITTIGHDDVIYTIYPPKKQSYKKDDSNNSSIVAKVTYGDYSMLFTGDAEKERIKEIVKYDDIESSIIKMPHHGGVEDNTDRLIKTVAPEYAIVTDSEEQPADEDTIVLLTGADVRTYFTKDGDITIEIKNDGIRITQTPSAK